MSEMSKQEINELRAELKKCKSLKEQAALLKSRGIEFELKEPQQEVQVQEVKKEVNSNDNQGTTSKD